VPSIPLLSSLRLPQSRHGAVNAALALMAFLLCLYTQSGPNTSAFGNEALRDLFVKANASTAPEPRIIVVDIDESSTARLGPWPWPRERVADLVETLLTDYGARGVALDIVFPDSADAAGDARLAALAGFGPVVLAHAFDFMRDRPVSLRQGTLAPGMPQPAGQALPATGFIANHAGLAESPHVGNIGFVPDADGVLRRLPMWVSFEGRTYPALSLALLTCCSGSPAPSLAVIWRGVWCWSVHRRLARATGSRRRWATTGLAWACRRQCCRNCSTFRKARRPRAGPAPCSRCCSRLPRCCSRCSPSRVCRPLPASACWA
jgi:hypothetical protein